MATTHLFDLHEEGDPNPFTDPPTNSYPFPTCPRINSIEDVWFPVSCNATLLCTPCSQEELFEEDGLLTCRSYCLCNFFADMCCILAHVANEIADGNPFATPFHPLTTHHYLVTLFYVYRSTKALRKCDIWALLYIYRNFCNNMGLSETKTPYTAALANLTHIMAGIGQDDERREKMVTWFELNRITLHDSMNTHSKWASVCTACTENDPKSNWAPLLEGTGGLGHLLALSLGHMFTPVYPDLLAGFSIKPMKLGVNFSGIDWSYPYNDHDVIVLGSSDTPEYNHNATIAAATAAAAAMPEDNFMAPDTPEFPPSAPGTPNFFDEN